MAWEYYSTNKFTSQQILQLRVRINFNVKLICKFVFGLAGTLIGILALLVLLSGAVQNALILFVIAFLVSPMGLPMAAAWLLGKVQDLRYAIQDRVYG